jgi:hypothetical protein
VIYFLFDIEDNASYIEEVGSWGNVMVGAVDESLLLYINLPSITVVPKDVAYAWKFAGKYKGSISVRENTAPYNQIDKSLLEPHKDKFKYTLSDLDKENGCLFHKAIMHFLLNKYYANKILISNSTPVDLRNDNWESEAELIIKKNKIIAEIESCQDWQETGILISDRFGVGHNPDAVAKIDL